MFWDIINEFKVKIEGAGYPVDILSPTQTRKNANIYIIIDSVRTLASSLDTYRLEIRLALLLAFQNVSTEDYFKKAEDFFKILLSFSREFNHKSIGYSVEGLRLVEEQYIVDVVFTLTKRTTL